MKTLIRVGIVGYGAYVPMYRLKAAEVNRMWSTSGEPVEEKAVVALDEDTITIAVECARQAVKRSGVDPAQIGAVYVGTESKPYAVKPSGTIVAEVIGATPKRLHRRLRVRLQGRHRSYADMHRPRRQWDAEVRHGHRRRYGAG